MSHDAHLDDCAAYVLGALTEEEHASFVTHLQSCAACREEVAALQSAAAILPAAVPQLRAPRELRSRVLSTVRSEAGLRRERTSPRVARRRSRWRPATLGAVAVAVAVTLVALALSSSGGGTRVYRAKVTIPGATATVRVSSSHAELTIAHMPQSPPGHIYEVWVKRRGNPQPTDALFTVSSAGSATVGVPGSTAGVTAIMVTAEPEGGTDTPTTAPVIVASLS